MPVKTSADYRAAIKASGMDIYSPIDPDDVDHYIPTPILEEMLNQGLIGLNLDGVAPRTRSKLVKEAACRALGYLPPKSFNKCQPRFTGQDFDTYNQQALNLQIWNEPIIATRRYALVRIAENGIVRKVKVVHGDVLIPLDKTNAITTKYQAKFSLGKNPLNLHSLSDTAPLLPYLANNQTIQTLGFKSTVSPVGQPAPGELLPIGEIFKRLSPLVGMRFPDAGRLQDRARGANLHNLVCKALGYQSYHDNGQFPDVRHQLLEVKLQTSPTIDLGLVLPESLGAVKGVHGLGAIQPRHCDTRYAIFSALIVGDEVELVQLHVVSGEDFFTHFPQMGGLVQNKKIQIPLPCALFGE